MVEPSRSPSWEDPRRTVRGACRWPGILVFVGASLVVLLLMALDHRVTFGVPLGVAACGVAVSGLLAWLGAFDAPENAPVVRVRPGWGRWLVLMAAALGAALFVIRAAVRGTLPGRGMLASVVIPTLGLLALYAIYRVVERAGGRLGVVRATGAPFCRGSFWLTAVAIVLYAPRLGSFSLIDPWETHYGEVAREILARGDWISLWWAQDGWFWSKPVLDFWIQALSFSLLGVDPSPDGILGAASRGGWPEPEWAARIPMLLLALFGQGLLYLGVAKTWGRRPAWLGAMVWMTTAFWALIARQSMTDLPYVALLCGAMGLFLCGVATNPQRLATAYVLRIGPRRPRLSAHPLLLGSIVMLSWPQILYLFSRNLTLVTRGNDLGFWWHTDRFFSGSGGGNCGLPGNAACRLALPVNPQPEPALTALGLALILGLVLWLCRGEWRLQRLYYLGAWLLLLLSGLAKGLPGLVIGGATLAAWLLVTKRPGEVTRLALPTAALLFMVILLPWFLQMTVRHGVPFLERLLVHDMYKRAFVHVHDTNAGEDVGLRYYIWQLGYGLFPFSGLCAMGLLFWSKFRSIRDRRAQTSAFLVLWVVVAFSIFSLSLTKFHHYAIPVVPPLAFLAGALWDRAVRGYRIQGTYAALGYGLGLLLLPALALWGMLRCWGGSWLGSHVPLVNGRGLGGTLSWLVLVTVSVTALIGLGRLVSPTRDSGRSGDGTTKLWGWLGVSAATITMLVGRDWLAETIDGRSGSARLIHLICYSYSRSWPKFLDFSPVLLAFTVLTTICLFGWVLPGRWRAHAAAVLGSVALCWTVWLVDGYLVRIAPHWGQRATLLAYYQQRRSPNELLVAYQMNWKGENFYTGNRVPAFVSSGQPFKDWVDNQRRSGSRVLFFTTEHSRIEGLRAELGDVRTFRAVTDRFTNDKFALVRVEL